jgi:hypothetical protein
VVAVTVGIEDRRRYQPPAVKAGEDLLRLQARIDHQAVASALKLGHVTVFFEGDREDGDQPEFGGVHKLDSTSRRILGKV